MYICIFLEICKEFFDPIYSPMIENDEVENDKYSDEENQQYNDEETFNIILRRRKY